MLQPCYGYILCRAVILCAVSPRVPDSAFPDIPDMLFLQSVSRWRNGEDDRFHGICNIRNLQKILLSEVCYDNYQPSSDTNVLLL